MHGSFRTALVTSAILALTACGGTPPPPKRGVLERDVSSWKFRRFQEVLDVEVWVPENSAVAYTASYVRSEAERVARIEPGDVVNVFVTRYQTDRGVLRAFVKFARRLAQEAGYAVEEDKVGGVRLFTIVGHDETWMMWAAPSHVVKVGGRDVKAVPASLVKAYGKRYPSRVAAGMLDGPLPEGPDEKVPKDAPYDPDNPTPDWDNYSPGDVKTPKKE